jgi:Fe-S-cluster containining protein
MNSDDSNPSDPQERSLRASLRILYDDLARDIAKAGPVCDLSGRCCRFNEWDHTLFLSGIEAKLLIEDAPPPVRALDDGVTCPWQNERGHCTAREARPLGCRVYFCDPNYQETGQILSERYLNRLKALADEYQHPWAYAPLHRHLREATTTGLWRSFEASETGSNSANPLTLL